MKRFVSFIFGALLFFGCSNSKDLGAADTSDQSSKFYGAKVAVNATSLPTCDSTKLGQLFYTIAEEQFHFCSELGYSVIDLQGKNGTNGTSGTSGINGNQGADGAGCSITGTAAVKTITCGTTTATVKDGESCTVAQTAEGYDLTCGKTTVSLYNGLDGMDGLNAVNCTVSDNGMGKLTESCATDTVTWPKALCNNVAYDPNAYSCSGTTLTALASSVACSGTFIDPVHFKCDNNVVVPIAQIQTTNLCLGVTYTPATQICDSRDGHLYTYATLGAQTWMTQNLNYLANSGTGNWCYGNVASNCTTYGRLYNWAAARDVAQSYNTTTLGGGDSKIQGVCPSGWHLANQSEWNVLLANWATYSTAFKAQSAGEWFNNQTIFDNVNIRGYYHASTENSPTGNVRFFYTASDGSLATDGYFKTNANSIRCIQN